jgi:hypothetical protein
MVVVSQARQEPEPMAGQLPAIEDLAWAQHAQPVADPGELAADIWESDAELAAFLARSAGEPERLAGLTGRA